GSGSIAPQTTGTGDLGTSSLGWGNVFIDKTITAGGTTGNQNINKNSFTVNFAATARTITLTDSRISTSSNIVCTVQKNDVTLKYVIAEPGSGSAVLTGNATATAETRVGCIVVN